jgi:hypothetical protein
MFWPNPYFSISSVLPAAVTVKAGSSAAYTVSTLANAGYTGSSITISVGGLPAGAFYNQGAVQPGATFALSIDTASSVPAGTYPLVISATDGSQSYFSYATLVIQ